MILIVSLIEEENSIFENEFIKPIVRIIKDHPHKVIHFSNLTQEKIKDATHIILSGTPLKQPAIDVSRFMWIKEVNVPLLGICAGAQTIAEAYGVKPEKEEELSLSQIEVTNEDPILENVEMHEVYNLHTLSIKEVPPGFTLIAKTRYPSIIRKGKTYAILFHPEVRNPDIIRNFIEMK